MVGQSPSYGRFSDFRQGRLVDTFGINRLPKISCDWQISKILSKLTGNNFIFNFAREVMVLNVKYIDILLPI